MNALLNNGGIIRLSRFAKDINKSKKEAKLILDTYQSANPNLVILFRAKKKGATSPWQVNLIKLCEAGFMQDHILISRESKSLKQAIDSLEERVEALEDLS